jgi:hypothetical protein
MLKEELDEVVAVLLVHSFEPTWAVARRERSESLDLCCTCAARRVVEPRKLSGPKWMLFKLAQALQPPRGPARASPWP